MRLPRRFLVPLLPMALALAPGALLLTRATPVGAEEGARLPDGVRATAIKRLGRQVRRDARSPHADRRKEAILTRLASLEVLGTHAAAEAALGAVVLDDAEIRDRAFALVEKERHEELVAPLARLLEDKDLRRDADLRRRVARALSVIAHPTAVAPLTDLVRTDEDAGVVAAAADALATYRSAPLADRKKAVKQLIDVYTATWNLMMSIRPEDRVMAARMTERWEVYGRAVRQALAALTGADLRRAQEWTRWWNDHKKRQDW